MAEHRAAVNALLSIFLVRNDTGAAQPAQPAGRDGRDGSGQVIEGDGQGTASGLPTSAHARWAITGGRVERSRWAARRSSRVDKRRRGDRTRGHEMRGAEGQPSWNRVARKPGIPLSMSMSIGIACSRSRPHAAYHVAVVRIGFFGRSGSLSTVAMSPRIDMSPTESAMSPAESTLRRCPPPTPAQQGCAAHPGTHRDEADAETDTDTETSEHSSVGGPPEHHLPPTRLYGLYKY
jgi:hypothetical protein